MITGPDENDPRGRAVDWHNAGRNETARSRRGWQAERRHQPAKAGDSYPAQFPGLGPVDGNDAGDSDAFDDREGPESGGDRLGPQVSASRA